MTDHALYPLQFDPIFQYRLWGGRRLGPWMNRDLPGQDPIGEAWLLSDRDDHPSKVASGPLAGMTLPQLMAWARTSILGPLAARVDRFPLLLKYLDVELMLSVQVHPADGMTALIPRGETGKTEAWVVIDADPSARIYAGLQPGATQENLASLTAETVNDRLSAFSPKVGQAVHIGAGTVHSLGDGVVVFEVQQNSDVTYRLYDWNHVDKTTGKPRPLQVEEALACVNFNQGAITPTDPQVLQTSPVLRERLLESAHFSVTRLSGAEPFQLGAENEPRIVVCLLGGGGIVHQDVDYPLSRGGVTLLPASVGSCRFTPKGAAELLEIAMPVTE